MMRAAAEAVGSTAIHVALSSIEVSLLGIVAFDPDALPAIRAGQRINTVDADDSGTLCHAVPLDAWPTALWMALATVILGSDMPPATPIDMETLYAARLVPDPAGRSLVSLTPFELGEGLRAADPDALARKDKVAARILHLEELEWSHKPIALIPRDALSEAGWQAIAAVLPDPDDRWRWSPALRIAARTTRDDGAARQRRATMRITELHAALHLACELPCAGYDVDGYHRALADAVLADPLALAMVRTGFDEPGDDLEIIRIMLDREGHRWRGAHADDHSAALAATSIA